ncbi:MAG: FmdB family zinc ribbon protein [Spirochaetota bacterium]
MPTYDYECSSCGHTFDAFQSMSDDPLKTCPECGKNALKRLIGGGMGIIFKGSGFYSTDSRSGAAASSSSSETGSSETSSNKEGSSKESSTKKESTSSGDGASKKASDAKVAG